MGAPNTDLLSLLYEHFAIHTAMTRKKDLKLQERGSVVVLLSSNLNKVNLCCGASKARAEFIKCRRHTIKRVGPGVLSWATSVSMLV